jgi:hypothetical protein
MKTKYLKGITAMGFAAMMLLFSSCLKDDARVFDPESVQSNVAELPLSGLNNFAKDAVLGTGNVTLTFAVGVTAKNVPTSPTSIVIGVDNTLTTAYVAANPGVDYKPIPTTAYTLAATNITIPAGKNSTTTTLIIDRTLLDPAVSYMIPVKIVSAPAGVAISANYGVHYYHIIGNDFAGPFTHDFRRTPAADFTGRTHSFLPDSPTQFNVVGGYYTGDVRYVVNFTKTIVSGVAMYSGFTIKIHPDDITNTLTPNGIAVTTPPSIVGYTAGTQYTYAQALQLFANGFTYQVLGGSGARTNLDLYHRP